MRCLQPPVSACISHVWRAIYLPRAVLQQPVVAFPDKRDWGAVGEERRGGAGQKVRAEGVLRVGQPNSHNGMQGVTCYPPGAADQKQ